MMTTASTKNGKNNLLNGQTAFVQGSERQSEISVILSIQEAELKGVRPDKLEKLGEGFETLNHELATALIRVVKRKVARKIRLERQRMNSKSMAHKGRPVYRMTLSASRSTQTWASSTGFVSSGKSIGVINQLRNCMDERQLAEVLLALRKKARRHGSLPQNSRVRWFKNVRLLLLFRQY